MAGTPSLLSLALLLLGAVGRAGPRPQVSPGDLGDKWEGNAAVFCGRRSYLAEGLLDLS